MLPLVEVLIGAFKETMDFSNKVLDHIDEEKYAKAVCELYGKEPSYKELDTAIELIKEDKSLPTSEKIQLLTLVSNQREELYEKALVRKKKHADMIDRGSRRKGETAVKIVGAVATGGVSLLPDAVKAIKGAVDKKSLADKAEAFDVGDVEEDDE